MSRASFGAAAAATLCSLVAPGTSAAPIPTPIGAGARFHPTPTSRAVAHRRPVGPLRCGPTHVRPERAHVELFAGRRVVIVPARIGVVEGCVYAVRTREPTGVVEFDPRIRPTIGDLFAIWGRRLSATGMLSFRGQVRAYVDGVFRPGDPGAIRLRRHAEIVLEIGRFVPPHRFFLFGPGR